MDLIKAKELAKTRSLSTRKKVFINVKNEMPVLANMQDTTSLFAYENGAEKALERKPLKTVPQNKSLTKTSANMATVTTTPAKKTATKNVPAKSAAKKTTSAPKRERAVLTKPLEGKTQTMTGKQLRARVEHDELVFNTKGKSIPCTRMAAKFGNKKFTVVTGNFKGQKAHQLSKGSDKE